MCVARHIGRVRTLYKSVLKLHRGLPTELQAFGDDYAKSEFRFVILHEIFLNCYFFDNFPTSDDTKTSNLISQKQLYLCSNGQNTRLTLPNN